MVEFHTLGGVALRGDGVAATGLSRHSKCLALLAYLCVAGVGGVHRRDKVVALLWPEADDGHGRGSLRKAIFQLRRCLGPDVLPREGDDALVLDPARLWCDAVACREALDAGEWCRALELYGGAFLDGMHLAGAPEFERWLEDERTALRRAVNRGAWAQVRAAEEAGEPGEAVRWALRAVELAPYEEAGFRRLVYLCDRNGDRGTALDAYERFSRLLREDLEVEPAPETRAAVEALRERGPSSVAVPFPDVRRRPDLSMAVLPFVSLGPDGAGRLLADGLHHELIFRLGATPGFKVTSRTTVMRFRDSDLSAAEIGGELGVGTLVEGTVHVDGRGTRVTLQMIDARRDEACWCGSFDREVDDPLRARVELARDMASRLAWAVRDGFAPESPPQRSETRMSMV